MAAKTFKIGLSNTDKQNMAQDVYERLLDLTFAEYDSGETYNTGDFVVYNDALYKCLEDEVTGAWDSTKWQSATLQDLLDDVEGAVASVTGKANTADLLNGTLVPEKSQTAKNLLPVSSTSGSTQTAPFINQGTATNNNDSQAEVDTGTLGQHLEKQGNTVAVNQLMKNPTFVGASTTNWDNGFANDGMVGGYLKLTRGDVSAPALQQPVYVKTGHKYLFVYDVYCVHGSGEELIFPADNLGNLQSRAIPTTKGTISAYILEATSGEVYIYSRLYVYGSGYEIYVKSIICIDLTQWFNGDIPQDLLDNPENFFRYYNGSLDYNTGTLVNSNGRYLVNGQSQNVWDEVTESGAINTATGADSVNASCIRSKNYIRVIPNRAYYIKSTNDLAIFYYDKDKNYIDYVIRKNTYIITPPNCYYIRFYEGVTTYANDITISLYYEGEDYSQYVAWKEPKVYDTGSEQLLAFDTKDPDGTIHRNTTNVADLSALTWSKESGYTKVWRTNDLTSLIDKSTLKFIQNKYSVIDINSLDDTTINTIAFDSVGRLFINNNSTENEPDGELQYKTATPTTEQGTPFSENMDINDMSNMAWYSAYTDENTNTLVSVPQGCKIFYPAWYAGFIDSLGQREDIGWASEQIVSQEQLGAVGNRVPALSPTEEDGTYTLKATKSGDTITYSWVADSE